MIGGFTGPEAVCAGGEGEACVHAAKATTNIARNARIAITTSWTAAQNPTRGDSQQEHQLRERPEVSSMKCGRSKPETREC